MFIRVAQIIATVAAITAVHPHMQDSIAGAWSATLPDVVRNEDGVQTVESTTTALFKLEVRGDSVFGTVTRGKATTGRPLRGTVRGTHVVLQGTTRARVNVNGSDHELVVITTYRFTRSGDAMTGTSETALDPSSDTKVSLPGVEQSPLPISAKRVSP